MMIANLDFSFSLGNITLYPLNYDHFYTYFSKLRECTFYPPKLTPFYTKLLNYENIHFIHINYDIFYAYLLDPKL